MPTQREQFPPSRPRRKKVHAGAAGVSLTPLTIRMSGSPLSDELDHTIRNRLSRRLGKFARHIERVTVRFEDVNGPRGGVDVVCRAKVVLSGMPSAVVSGQAETEDGAFTEVADALTRSVRKTLERAPRSRRGRARRRRALEPRAESSLDAGSLIGRRVGRGAANLARALERPEKRRRDVYVDTAAPGVSATDRKAGGGATARRNTRKKAPRATAALEDSREARPSRKSTRKSANRARGATNLQKRAVAAARSPQARAAKARR